MGLRIILKYILLSSKYNNYLKSIYFFLLLKFKIIRSGGKYAKRK